MKAHIRTIRSSVGPTTPKPSSKSHYFSFLFSFLVKRKMQSTREIDGATSESQGKARNDKGQTNPKGKQIRGGELLYKTLEI